MAFAFREAMQTSQANCSAEPTQSKPSRGRQAIKAECKGIVTFLHDYRRSLLGFTHHWRDH